MTTFAVNSDRLTKAELEMLAGVVLHYWDSLNESLKSGFENKFPISIQWKKLIDTTQEDFTRVTPTASDGERLGVLNIDARYEETEGILLITHYCRQGNYITDWFKIKQDVFLDIWDESDAIFKAVDEIRAAFAAFKALPEPKPEPETEKAES